MRFVADDGETAWLSGYRIDTFNMTEPFSQVDFAKIPITEAFKLLNVSIPEMFITLSKDTP
jgi:hypothetical protein